VPPVTAWPALRTGDTAEGSAATVPDVRETRTVTDDCGIAEAATSPPLDVTENMSVATGIDELEAGTVGDGLADKVSAVIVAALLTT
jgi:hypothetical protein